MTEAARPEIAPELGSRLEQLGRQLGAREGEHREALERARSCARSLHADVGRALARFHDAVAEAGAPHLRVELGDVRLDDKHLRAIEFDLTRGRHKAIVIAKSRGEVTLVGPFKTGKAEGPCLSFPIESREEIQRALGTFLERFLEEAATP
jgi:hypothetical protein